MRTVTPYKDRITEKNIADFADMVKDAAGARSYGSRKSWYIGSDGSNDWAISASWVDKKDLILKLVNAQEADGRFDKPYSETGTKCDGVAEVVDREAPKTVVISQVKHLLDTFFEVCGYHPEPVSYVMDGAEAV